ncbi:hypothetical protein ACLMCB_16085 [Paenibacillus sp. S29]
MGAEQQVREYISFYNQSRFQKKIKQPVSSELNNNKHPSRTASITTTAVAVAPIRDFINLSVPTKYGNRYTIKAISLNRATTIIVPFHIPAGCPAGTNAMAMSIFISFEANRGNARTEIS